MKRSYRIQSVTNKCLTCGAEFHPYRTPQKTLTVFCSRQCSGKNMVGKTSWNKGLKCDWSMEKHPRWKGGKRIINGYVYIYQPSHPFTSKQGYIAEHRLTVEKYIGRYLRKDETIHHINHIRDDNRIENLELMDKTKHHQKHGFERFPKGSMFGRNS